MAIEPMSTKDYTQAGRIEDNYDSCQLQAILEQIRLRCSVPAISVGVLHEGKNVFNDHVGFRSVSNGSEGDVPDLDTVYALSSLSKTFVTAAFCLLVHELDTVSWSDPVNKHLPSFCPKDDPTIAEVTFKEILRHSSGIDNPVVTWLGPKGRPLVSKDSFIDLLNHTPTRRYKESMRDSLVYSNVAYGLVVLVIEELSDTSFAEFVQDRFLTPLKMHNTAVTNSQVDALDKKNQLAHSYVKLSDGSWKPQESTWTDENHGPLLGMIGMRSSTRDMLTLFSALMDAYYSTASEESKSKLGADKWSKSHFETLDGVDVNPFKGVQAMFDAPHWWLPCKCNGRKEHIYYHHMPWIRADMPCEKFSWGSYNMSPGHEHSGAVFGASQAEERLSYHFNGVCIFGTTAVKWFPKTRSIVVAFASGLNAGDAAEFASLLLTQWLFDLEPKKDILNLVDEEVSLRLESFDSAYLELDEHRSKPTPCPELFDYVGEYTTLGVTLLVQLIPNCNALGLSFKGSEDIVLRLKPYGTDQFSFWPENRDEWLAGGWLDWDYYEVGLITFQRSSDSSRSITAAGWVWEDGAEPAIFEKDKENVSRLGDAGVEMPIQDGSIHMREKSTNNNCLERKDELENAASNQKEKDAEAAILRGQKEKESWISSTLFNKAWCWLFHKG